MASLLIVATPCAWQAMVRGRISMRAAGHRKRSSTVFTDYRRPARMGPRRATTTTSLRTRPGAMAMSARWRGAWFDRCCLTSCISACDAEGIPERLLLPRIMNGTKYQERWAGVPTENVGCSMTQVVTCSSRKAMDSERNCVQRSWPVHQHHIHPDERGDIRYSRNAT